MASCQVGLGESILKKIGLAQIKGTNDTIDGFITALQAQLDSFFKAGAIASSRAVPCIEEKGKPSQEMSVDPESETCLDEPENLLPNTGETFQDQQLSIKDCTSTEVIPAGFSVPVNHQLATGISHLGVNTLTPSPALFMLASKDDIKTCCRFFGKVTSFGDAKLKLNLTIKYGVVDVAVSIDLGYSTRIAGTTHRGLCNPPKICQNESVIADILVIYTGKFKLKVSTEIDLGPIGKVKAGGVGLDLSAQGVDVVKCTLTC